MEKRGLGRGLAALIPDMDERKGGDVAELALEQIQPNPYQPRTLFDPIKLEELAASVREHGVLQPILVRRVGHERYELVAGERRFRAAQRAGLKVVPALVRECTEREQLEVAIVENVQREDIGVIEAARAYRRMIDEFGLTQELIAQRVGKSRSTVANTLRILGLPEEVQESLERGEITEGHGRALLSAEEPEAILYFWHAVLRRKLSVRDTEKLVRADRNGGPSDWAGPSAGNPVVPASPVAVPERSDPNEVALIEEIQRALNTRVTLKRTGAGVGRIEIEFYSLEDLERIVEAIAPQR